MLQVPDVSGMMHTSDFPCLRVSEDVPDTDKRNPDIKVYILLIALMLMHPSIVGHAGHMLARHRHFICPSELQNSILRQFWGYPVATDDILPALPYRLAAVSLVVLLQALLTLWREQRQRVAWSLLSCLSCSSLQTKPRRTAHIQ